MKKILVPMDFSTASNAALKMAVQIARKNDSALQIYYNSSLPRPMGELSLSMQKIYENQLTEELAAVEKMYAIRSNPLLSGVTFQFEVGYGNINMNLDKKANEKDIDLVIMGSKGKEQLEDYMMGSTTLKALRFLDKPVLIVKETVEDFNPQNIIFASDFQFESLDALKRLLAYTKEWSPIIHLLNIDVKHEFVNTPNLFKNSIADFVEECGDNLGIVYSHFDENISKGIAQVVNAYDADLVVIGTHSREYSNIMYTSFISESIVHALDVPVMTIRVGEEE